MHSDTTWMTAPPDVNTTPGSPLTVVACISQSRRFLLNTPARNRATRSRPRITTRAADTLPPPSEWTSTSSVSISSTAFTSPARQAATNRSASPSARAGAAWNRRSPSSPSRRRARLTICRTWPRTCPPPRRSRRTRSRTPSAAGTPPARPASAAPGAAGTPASATRPGRCRHARSRVSTGSGTHGPTYSRRRRARSRSMHRRVVVRIRNPSGEDTPPAVW